MIQQYHRKSSERPLRAAILNLDGARLCEPQHAWPNQQDPAQFERRVNCEVLRLPEPRSKMRIAANPSEKFWGFTNPPVCLTLRLEMTGFWFMNALLFGFIGMWETVAILAVILVLFGAKKVPELARGLGQGIKEFKKATKEVNDDIQRVFDEDEPPPPPRKLSSSKPQETVPHTNEPKG
jgi:sec-independent protein translocase protein TatA